MSDIRKESNDITTRMSEMSDDDLVTIVAVNASDYREEAISIAKEELIRRGIETVDERKVKELKAAFDLSSIPVKWLLWYTYFALPIGVVRAIFVDLSEFSDLSYVPYNEILMSTTILLCVFVVVVIVGLHKRRLWGWKLNWVLLALNSLLAPFGVTQNIGYYFMFFVLFLLVYFWPNYIYFQKRRILFNQ